MKTCCDVCRQRASGLQYSDWGRGAPVSSTRAVQKAERSSACCSPAGVRKASNQVVLPSPLSRDQWF